MAQLELNEENMCHGLGDSILKDWFSNMINTDFNQSDDGHLRIAIHHYRNRHP